ncbi:MAG: hypothetical protein HY913_09595 [Desulfomonile tiedjei]|nr:hypothetical protein [Desulfomonile tiedjei]
MADDPSETLYTVVITKIQDASTKARVTRGLARIIRNLPVEQIAVRLEKVPWTLTRRASLKKASRLVDLLEKLGAAVEVFPPLPPPIMRDVAGTQILPGTKLLSETQVADSTEFVAMPEPVTPSSTPRPLSMKPPEPEAQKETAEDEDSGAFDIEPLTLAGILDRTFQICRRHFWKLFVIDAIPWLAMAAIGIVAAIIVGIVGLTWKSLGGFPTWILIVAGAALIPSAFVFLIGVFYLAQGAMIHAVSSIYIGRPIMIKEAYRFVFGRLGRLFLTTCLFGLAAIGMVALPMISGSFIFFAFREVTGSGWWSVVTWPFLAIIPFYGITKLMLFDKVVIIEGVAYGSALKRSWNLLSGKAEGPWPRGYFLKLIILLHILILVWIAIDILFNVPATLLALFLSEPSWLGTVVKQFVAQIAGLVAGIFMAVSMVVFYYDIRNRKEGFDLQMLSEMDYSTSQNKSRK